MHQFRSRTSASWSSVQSAGRPISDLGCILHYLLLEFYHLLACFTFAEGIFQLQNYHLWFFEHADGVKPGEAMERIPAQTAPNGALSSFQKLK